MLANKMTALRLQKRTLVLENELNRLTLRAELQQLRAVRTWLGLRRHPGQRVEPWGLVLAPLVGVVLALSVRRTMRLFGSIAQVIGAARGTI